MSTTSQGSVSVHTNPSAFTLKAAGGRPLLEITFDGEIAWHGPPSRGSRALIRSFSSILDLDTIGNAAAERIYRRAMEKCLKMAKIMDSDEFIDRLDQELQTRISKAVLMELRSDNDRLE
jgi:hypothetical protein